jgi:hypothetical protein
MSGMDEWDNDPTVRAMRMVFKEIEDAQERFFSRMEINSYDQRIRHWRETALIIFERAVSYANRVGILINEKTASDIYLHCLARIMRSDGIDILEAFLPKPKGLEGILKEVL